MPVPLFWALGFANLPLLYGLAAASVPIVIHLLNRRKFREVSWAAMRFLLAALRKNRRRIRIEQWLLLAIRTLVILLVVTAMAKPFLEGFGALIAGQRTHRVIVLDASLSMGYTSAESSRFDQAKALAAQLVKDSRRGDAISIILMGAPPRVVIGDPSTNLGEVRKEIDELTLSDEGTDLAATLEAVDRVLDVSTIPQKEVVFLTDLQAASWRPPEQGTDGLKRLMARLESRRARSVVIDLGRAGGENRAVTELTLETPVVTVGYDRPASRRSCITSAPSAPMACQRGSRSTTARAPRNRSIFRPVKTSRWSSAINSPARATVWSRFRSITTPSFWTTGAGWLCRSASRSASSW